MDSAGLRKQLIEWLNEIKWWSGASTQSWDDYILTDEEWYEYQKPNLLPGFVKERDGDKLHVVLFSDGHEYRITVTEKSLIASASCRKRRAGENWFRGNDLPDGPFCKKTWDEIMRGILRFELIAKAKKIEPSSIPGVFPENIV